jgi:hypothetical protein
MKTWAELHISLPQGAKGEVDTTCPECSHARKKKGAKCLSVNVEKGSFLCHHCSWRGSLQGGVDGASDPWTWKPKVFTKPEYPVDLPLTDPVIAWFQARGISSDTLNQFHVSGGCVYMPGTEQREDVIQFPYYRDGELINVKYRSLSSKDFRMVGGAERILYGLDNLKDQTMAIITEGECFPDDAEVLTPTGWVMLRNWNGDTVLQVTDSLIGEFVTPIAYIKKPFHGSLLRFEKGGNYVSETTPGHRLAYLTKPKNGRLIKRCADEMPKAIAGKIPTTVHVHGPGLPYSDAEIALALAISADASIRKTKTGRYAVFAFKKQRKTERLTRILQKLEMKASITKIKNERDSICFRFPEWVPGRFLPWEWVWLASQKQRRFILEEMVFWDGNSVPHRAQTEYGSKEYENASWMQAMAHTSGQMSTIMPRSNQYGEWYKVSVLHNKSGVSWQKNIPTEVPYNGEVYCLTVPSGMLLVRQESKITVTGNCDALSLHGCGYPVVSVPDGAPTPNSKGLDVKLNYLNTALPWLDPLTKIKRCQ